MTEDEKHVHTMDTHDSDPDHCVLCCADTKRDLRAEVERLEAAVLEEIGNRDRFEEVITKLAEDAGCPEEWSSLHDHGDCITNEWADKLGKSKLQIDEARKLLTKIKDTAETSDAWWMDCPDRGGIDVEAIEQWLSHRPQETSTAPDRYKATLEQFAWAFRAREEHQGKTWSLGYWDGVDPGLALVSKGDTKGLENSEFHAVLKYEPDFVKKVLGLVGEDPCHHKWIVVEPNLVGILEVCGACEKVRRA